MSIQKFKSLEDAQRALWNFNPDRDYYKGLADLFKLASTYAKPFCERGVFKFKTLEQAKEHQLKNAEDTSVRLVRLSLARLVANPVWFRRNAFGAGRPDGRDAKAGKILPQGASYAENKK